MKRLLLIVSILLLAGCASGDGASLFDRLEFKPGQEGCIRVTGQVATGSNPFVSSNVSVSLVKKQGDNVPDC